MQTEERLRNYPIHDSIRGSFGLALYKEMVANESIWLLTADLGFGLLDPHKEDFPERFVNCGASECSMLGAAVGLSLSNKIVFCYSITTFLIYRAFEWHRNYLNHEQIPVFLIGSGYEDDYKHDGITHQPYEVGKVLDTLPNIWQYYPEEKESIPHYLELMIMKNKPAFMCLRR
jgi:transketolase